MNSIVISRFPELGYACNEAVNTLCTNLTFSGENVRKIMFTSSHASEGKSWLTMNVMRTMARLGKSVVLVDADLRRSVITSRYGFRFSNPQSRVGLAHYLAGKAGEDEIIYSTDIAGAYVVPIGREVFNPLPLLNSDRFDRLLDSLAQRADYVLVDAPPVGLVIDAAQIARSCDGTLIVVSYNQVHRQELIDVRDQLEQTGCPILGTVLNMVEYKSYLSKKYYYKAYYSNYESQDSSGRKGGKSRADKSKKKKGDGAKRA